VEEQRRDTSTKGTVQILDPATVEGAVVVAATSTPITPATVENVKVSVLTMFSLSPIPVYSMTSTTLATVVVGAYLGPPPTTIHPSIHSSTHPSIVMAQN
jgi:hypothetical protein